MWEQIKEFFDVQEFFWFLVGIMVPSVYNYIKNKIRKNRMKRKIKKDDINFADGEIVSLAHGAPFLEEKDLQLDKPKDIFHVAIPEEIKKQILEHNPEFDNTQWQDEQAFLAGKTEDDMLREVAEVLQLTFEETKQLYLEEKVNVANHFLTKIKNGEPYFNGEVYGINKLRERRIGKDENPKISIQSYKTDYYTHRVMAAMYRKVYAKNTTIMPGNDVTRYNKMRYFLTAMGMNVLVFLQDEEKIVFAKRSGNLFNMSGSAWHVSMNEAVSITDISDTNQTISLEKCIRRGLNEELGISEKLISESDDANQITMSFDYSDIFFLKDPFETGISAFVTISGMSFADLVNCYSAAKDRELETEELIAVNFSKRSFKDFIKKNTITPTAQYLIKMLLARHLNGSI